MATENIKNTLLQINVVGNYGSTGTIVDGIGELALAKGWNTIIAYGRYGRPSQSKLIKIGTAWDNKVHAIRTRLLDQHGYGSYGATIKLINQISQIKPSVIHLHNIHGYYLNINVLFGYLNQLQTPVVWTLHDCWPFTGHCIHYESIECDKWKKICHNCPQLHEYPSSYYVDNSTENYEIKKRLFTSHHNLTLIPVSKWISSQLDESFLQAQKKIQIYNGIDTNEFKPKPSMAWRLKYGLQSKYILLGVASQWSDKKGMNDFIALSNILEDSYHIVMVGMNKKQIKKLPKNILGLERTEDTQRLVELYSTCDIYLNPTYEDTFPTTNLEALACGTPVITYNTGGSAEALNRNTGLVVKKGQIMEMVTAIKNIYSNTAYYSNENCRQHAIRRFRKEDRFLEYIKLYEHLLEGENVY